MAAIDITISGVLYDKLARTTRPVTIIGEASYTGLSVGGGPIIPPPVITPPDPPVINPPDPPITVPPPGSPPVILNPDAHPAHPIAIPPYVIIDYPGIGKVMVPQPVVA